MGPLNQISWGKVPNAPLQASPMHEQTRISCDHLSTHQPKALTLVGSVRVCRGTWNCRAPCVLSHTTVLFASESSTDGAIMPVKIQSDEALTVQQCGASWRGACPLLGISGLGSWGVWGGLHGRQ